jgi:hypothetical protein
MSVTSPLLQQQQQQQQLAGGVARSFPIGASSGGMLGSSTLSINTGGPVQSYSAPSKLQEFVESPRSKQAYKEFCRELHFHEKSSYAAAVEYGVGAINKLPENAKWHAYLDLADIAKRNNLMQEV